MPKERNSNIELLRIVCILFVLVHHILYHGVGIYRGACESYPYLYSFVNQLCYVAVDVFFLISGYFAIRTNWKKLLWLYLMCGIVGGLGYAFNCVLTGHSVGKSILRYVLFGFSNSRGWYADVYLYLFLLAPFINVALQSMSKRMHHYLLGTLTVMSVYLGWFWGMGINATGFCLMQAVLMYSIGYYLRNFFDFSRVPRMAWGGAWLLASLCNVLLVWFIQTKWSHVSWPSAPVFDGYNCPLTIMGAIGLFGMFQGVKFQSKVVNVVAGCTFGVYLLHGNEFVFPRLLDNLRPMYMSSFGGVLEAALLVYVVCVAIDLVMRYGVINPVSRGVEWLVERIKAKKVTNE